jgi:hypothetical protein
MRTTLLTVVLLSMVSSGDAAGAPSRPLVVRVDSGGFHWLDAGIGAAAALAMVLLALAVAATWRPGPVRSPLKREEP